MGEDYEPKIETIGPDGGGESYEDFGPIGDDDGDTEGHALRPQVPGPPAVARKMGPGEHGIGPGESFIRGDGTPADFLDDRDTEGHIEFRRMPGDGGE
ncbi:MAG TPA: hypothetical protein VFR14_10180 [Candidatus Limnocylindrales bacterium]|nr:hypothetical protein [Candidatus Limnocylindrales bacterium]